MTIGSALRTLSGVLLISLAMRVMGRGQVADGIRDALSGYSRRRQTIKELTNVR
jgi:hypothetical protein